MDKKIDCLLEQICLEYGLNIDSLKTYKDYIYLKHKYNDIVFVFDKNYNILLKNKWNNYEDDEWYIHDIIDTYENYDDKFIYADYFSYKLKGLSLKKIEDFKDRIDIIEYCQQIHLVEINGKWYDYLKNDQYQEFILYIKFLNNEINHYRDTSYSLMSLNMNVPDIYSYLRAISNKINWWVYEYCRVNKILTVDTLLRVLGKNQNYYNKHLLENAIRLNIRLNGYQIDDDNNLVKKEFNIENYNKMIDEVLNLLNVSKEEIEENKKQGMIRLKDEERINKISEQIGKDFIEEPTEETEKNPVKVLNRNTEEHMRFMKDEIRKDFIED